MAQQVEAHVLKKYALIKKVGSGAYGHVWKVTDSKTNQVFALKKIFDAFQHSTDAQRTFRQIVLLHEITHPNIIKLHNVMRAHNDKDLYLVFEFMQADLHNAINQKILKDAHHRFILYQLAKGLKYLHSAGIIHRDLKPSNLLLNSDCNMKICDFGLARSINNDINNHDAVLTEEVATRWYRAPEVLLGSQKYDKSADVWSVGCILAQMLAGKPFFPGNSTFNQLQRILAFTGRPSKDDIQTLGSQNAFPMIDSVPNVRVREPRQWFRSNVPSQAVNLVSRMLEINPQRRITINELLRSPYLAQFSNPKEQLESKKIIKPPVPDDTKLNLKQYRQLIYDRIKKIYRSEQQDPQETPIEVKTRPNSYKKPDDAGLIRPNSRTGSHGKMQILKGRKPSFIPGQKFSLSYSGQEQDLRRKNSLKDMLRNKKTGFSKTNEKFYPNFAHKYYRQSDTSQLKENKYRYC